MGGGSERIYIAKGSTSHGKVTEGSNNDVAEGT